MSSSNPENNRSSAEVEHLNKLEAIVRRGLDSDLEVGKALAEINDTWLYRATHQTFEGYLRDRWGINAERAEQLIQAAVDIHLTVHKRPEQPPQVRRSPWQTPQRPDEMSTSELLRRLRWLMGESSGTIAYIAHELETRAAELDEEVCEQLRDDVLVLDEDLARLKSLLLPPVDWDAELEGLIAGEIPPFDDDFDED